MGISVRFRGSLTGGNEELSRDIDSFCVAEPGGEGDAIDTL